MGLSGIYSKLRGSDLEWSRSLILLIFDEQIVNTNKNGKKRCFMFLPSNKNESQINYDFKMILTIPAYFEIVVDLGIVDFRGYKW